MADPESEEAPPDLVFQNEVLDLNFHPSSALVASALITGEINVHAYGMEKNEEKFKSNVHVESCRAVRFNHDGSYLFSASADASLVCFDTNTGQVVHRKDTAHLAGINALFCVGELGLVASGDDDGCVKLWDMRQRSCVMEFSEHTDFISDITALPYKKTLVVTSGDGTLSAMNWRKKSRKNSVEQEDELLSLTVMKENTKVVCGTQDGYLVTYKWGDWGDWTDRMVGHPKSIDAIAKIDENIVCTGSSDGFIRVVNIHPNKFLGIIGEHEHYPVERLRVSGDGAWLGSCSHDQTVKFWNLEGISTLGDENDSDSDDEATGKKDDNEDGDAMEDDEYDPKFYEQDKRRRKPGVDDFFSGI